MLEAILRAYSRKDEYESKRSKARDNVRKRHAHNTEKTVIE